MAVIPAVKWIEVQVLVKDVALKEYDADDDELEMKRDDHDRFISRYIEAKTGAEFIVKIMIDGKSQRLPKDGDLTCLLTIDGEIIESRALRRSDFRKGYDFDFAGYRYYANGKPHEKTFKFSQLHIVEDAAAAPVENTDDYLAHTGKICVTIRRAKMTRKGRYITASDEKPQLVTDLGDVSEKAVKGRALSHNMCLGDARPVERYRTSTVEYIDDSGKPFLTYEFRYRSIQALKALRVIPGTPPPTSLQERPLEELTREELLEIARLQRDRQAQNDKIKIKREREDDDAVLGRSTRAFSTLRSGETIDLTDD